MSRIGFNKPYFTGKEINYIMEAVKHRKSRVTDTSHNYVMTLLRNGME